MIDFECPKCGAGFDSGSYPDHWMGGVSEFKFGCRCDHVFKVSVEWSPSFDVIEEDT